MTDPGNGFSNLSSIVVASSECLRRMQEELHDVGIPGSTPGCAQLAQWSNGRTPMRRFSTDRRRRQGSKTLNYFAANAEGTTWVPGSNPGCSIRIGAVAQWVEQ